VKTKDLTKAGIPKTCMKLAQRACREAARAKVNKREIKRIVADVTADPSRFLAHGHFGALAQALLEHQQAAARWQPREQPAPWRQWGQDLEEQAIQQMRNACQLPISVRGALMPDAHLGYGLPIGGVLATRGAVIPYAVGMDIACRMKMTVLDLPVSALRGQRDRLVKVLERETAFGVGASFQGANRHEHAVMDEDWSFCPVLKRGKDKAWAQLGTSGSGNHFAEYGELVLDEGALGLEPGTYLALLTHSGSRGIGSQVAQHYSRLAMEQHPELPRQLKQLAWLELDDEPGREYWAAMELMGRYAAANHELIHGGVARGLRADVLLDVENHHNFAWIEEHEGQRLAVHRKGATPASEGALGIIPGSMGTPAFLVRGLGEPLSLDSASHGAGRAMSRKAAKRAFRWADARRFLKKAGVELISAGLDEVPMAYKDIEQVMAAQRDLVQPLARFHPRLVKMAPG